MKTTPPQTMRAADWKQPVRRATLHSTAHVVAEAPAPRAAGTRAAGAGGMSMSDAIALLADTAIRNALHAHAEPRRAARLIMLTVQGACRDCGVAALETISLIARVMVRVTAQLGGDVAAVTIGLVQGAIDSATSAGISAETAAAAAADGALQAAGLEGCTATASVHGALAPIVTFAMIPGREPAARERPAPSPGPGRHEHPLATTRRLV